MGKALAVIQNPLPLLCWPEQARIDALVIKREELHRRIEALRPNAHHRIVLEARMREVTARLLQMEADISSPQMTRLQS